MQALRSGDYFCKKRMNSWEVKENSSKVKQNKGGEWNLKPEPEAKLIMSQNILIVM